MKQAQALFIACLITVALFGVGCTMQEAENQSIDQMPTEKGEVAPHSVQDASATPDQAGDRLEARGTTVPRHLPERVPALGGDAVTGEVPQDLLDVILDDLVERTGASRTAVEVQRAEAVVWNDGSLGCPEPGMNYTQALVNGYWVVLMVENEAYDYRASDSGYFFLCEERVTPTSTTSEPGADAPPNR